MNFLQKIQRILAGVLGIDHRNTSEREKVPGKLTGRSPAGFHSRLF
ncbi:MAG: hypothetical protein A4E40_00557 [Methanoregulaceae archaeon PtaU1.Bin059]|nr:MAG: hypothetical protein A4E40_00557 [Methanoregulaceae archaeon PtaU1.Bin059]